VHVVARSWKYHRPRGIVACGVEEPNAIVQLETGAGTVPNARATEVALYDGLVATSVNAWPSVDFDLMSSRALLALHAGRLLLQDVHVAAELLDALRALHPQRCRARDCARPKRCRPLRPDERALRRTRRRRRSGRDSLPALAAGNAGARVIPADEQHEFGGSPAVAA
jgi:sarcosine oxidase subunit alpha